MNRSKGRMGHLERLDLSAPDVGSTSGRESVVIGTYSWLPGGGVGFLGLWLPMSVYVQVADVVHGKLLRRPVSGDPRIVLPARRPGAS